MILCGGLFPGSVLFSKITQKKDAGVQVRRIHRHAPAGHIVTDVYGGYACNTA
jgi:hypothetical protein